MPCWRRQPPSSLAPNIIPLYPPIWPACTMRGRRQLSPARGKPLWLLGVQLIPDLGSQGVFHPRCIPRQFAVQVNASRWHRPRGTYCFALRLGRALMEETTGDTLCGPRGKNGGSSLVPERTTVTQLIDVWESGMLLSPRYHWSLPSQC